MTDQEQKLVSPDEVQAAQAAKIGISKIDLKIPPRRLSDVMEEIAPEGTPSKLSDWQDLEITIVGLHFFKGRFGDCAYVQFVDGNGELYNMICGQKIILPKLAVIEKLLPVSATVRKVEGGQFGSYWDLE